MVNLGKQTTQLCYFLNKHSILKSHFKENLLLKYDKRKCIQRSKMVECVFFCFFFFSMFKDFQQGNITSPNRKKMYKLSLCPNSRQRRVIAVIIYLLTLLLICVFLLVMLFFSSLITFGNWNNLLQPLVIVKYFLRIHMKYSETYQEMLGENWKE